MTYGLIVKITAKAGARDELAAIFADLPTMPGCLSYVVAHDSDDPDGLWVTEVWESAEAHRDSLELPEVRQAIALGKPLIESFEHRFETTPVAGSR